MEQPLLGTNNRYCLFVGNLSPRITESELRTMVERFGRVKNVNMVKVHAMDVKCGFAFVDVTDEGAAARVITGLNGKSIDGRCLKVRLGF